MWCLRHVLRWWMRRTLLRYLVAGGSARGRFGGLQPLEELRKRHTEMDIVSECSKHLLRHHQTARRLTACSLSFCALTLSTSAAGAGSVPAASVLRPLYQSIPSNKLSYCEACVHNGPAVNKPCPLVRRMTGVHTNDGGRSAWRALERGGLRLRALQPSSRGRRA